MIIFQQGFQQIARVVQLSGASQHFQLLCRGIHKILAHGVVWHLGGPHQVKLRPELRRRKDIRRFVIPLGAQEDIEHPMTEAVPRLAARRQLFKGLQGDTVLAEVVVNASEFCRDGAIVRKSRTVGVPAGPQGIQGWRIMRAQAGNVAEEETHTDAAKRRRLFHPDIEAP